MAVPGEALEAIATFCKKRVPARRKHDLRVECTARGNAVTITESRQLWADVSEEWISRRVAQLRFDPESTSWSLYWSEGGSRWQRLDDLGDGPLPVALAELDADTDGVFWT